MTFEFNLPFSRISIDDLEAKLSLFEEDTILIDQKMIDIFQTLQGFEDIENQ